MSQSWNFLRSRTLKKFHVVIEKVMPTDELGDSTASCEGVVDALYTINSHDNPAVRTISTYIALKLVTSDELFLILVSLGALHCMRLQIQ